MDKQPLPLPELKEKFEKYHSDSKKMFKEIIDNGLKGAEAQEALRLVQGGTDYSLFNLMLERVDFKKCNTMMDAMRGMYEALWPYYAKVIKENAYLRERFSAHIEEITLSEGEEVKLKEIFESDISPNMAATRVLKQITEAAKKRRKLNLY